MRKFICILILASAAFALPAAEPTESHRAAAIEFMKESGTPELLERQCRLMVEKQVQAQPELAAHKDKLLDFYRGAFGFEALKDDLAAVYAREFTEEELRELIRFYDTPLGRKYVSVNEKLIPELAEIFERKVREKAAAAAK